MDYFEAVHKRYSVRAYKPDPVEPEKLQRILECARLAPTAHNRQTFKIIVVKTEGHRELLKNIYLFGGDWFVSAPYLLGVCSIPNKCWVRGDGKNYSDVDAAIVMDHIILAATALELGTCWVASFDTQAARAILKLEGAWEPVAFTPLGYPAATAAARKRKPLEELVVYRGTQPDDLQMAPGQGSGPKITGLKALRKFF